MAFYMYRSAYVVNSIMNYATYDNPIVTGDDFDEWLLEDNRRMAYQGMLDEYSNYNVFEAD